MNVRIVRGAGERPDPEPIVDALLTDQAAAKERGRNHLAEQGADKERYDIGAPYRGAPLPGAVVRVHDASLGASFPAYLRSGRIGVSRQGGALEVTADYGLERSLDHG